MALNFQVKRRGSEFIIITGIPHEQFYNEYYQDALFLGTFVREGNDYIIPRQQLCSVLDRCFDHFTEESLLNITKLLDKNEDAMRDRIHEQSVSKKKKTRDIRQERPVVERNVERQERPVERPVERQERPVERQERPVERQERPVERQERTVERQERPERERPGDRTAERQERERQVERQERTVSYQDDYKRMPREEELSKTEVLKLFYQIKSQMDVLERYLHRVK